VLLKHFLSEELQEMTAGDVIEKNRLLRVAASGDVGERTGIFEAKLAGHGEAP
jgi:hypothetical protein